jgi:hypothetical protein
MSASSRTLFAALLLAAFASCGGPASGTPQAGLDPELEDSPSPRTKRRKEAKADLSQLPALSLETLSPAEAPAEETPRNLFAFEEDPAVVAERKRQAEEAAARAEEARKKAEEERKKREEELRQNPPPPQPPPIPFHFVGYFGRPERRFGVFAGPSGMVLAEKGDDIFGTFKVVDIGYESAEIGFTGFQETQRIPLTGGK